MALLALILNALVCEKYGETAIEKRGHTEGEFSMGEMRELTVSGIRR